MDKNSLLTPEQAAEVLQVSTSTMRDWRSKKNGPKYRKLGKWLIRYSVADLEEFAGGPIATPRALDGDIGKPVKKKRP